MTPKLVFDGDCAFCKRWIERWKAATGDGVEYVSLQAWPDAPLPREELAKAVTLVLPDGTVLRAAAAVFRALAAAPDLQWPWWLYRRIPPFAAASEWVYRCVSGHRVGAARLARFAWGDEVPPSYRVTRSLFLRGLALIYAIAFVSFWVQADGLVGSRGIWPLHEYLGLVTEKLGRSAWWEMPSLFLLGSSDGALHAACAAGLVLSVALAAGAWPRGSLFGLWALYLSVQQGGLIFLGYQWDLLLLEVGFVAIAFAPAGFWPRSRTRPPSWASLWLLRVLLFRLMFMSGAVKWLSGDESWRNLTALQLHYWTQPLPTWTSAFANDLSAGVQSFCCAVMFAIELGAPFLIFGGRRMRQTACSAFALLQVLILLTGNYGFFNWLTLVLCLVLLDDAVLGRVLPSPRVEAPRPRKAWERWMRRGVLITFAFVYLAASTGEMTLRLERHRGREAPFADLVSALAPFRIVSGYGLFAVMTADRLEIIVEGSADGTTWKPYELPWKPGRVDQRPRFVAPHQPRLDWQFWFASLGTCRQNPWFIGFQRRLLEGSPDVLALLSDNPFPAAPPLYVRSTLYRYRFAPLEERRRGVWWTRTEVGAYCPQLTLEDGILRARP